MGALAGLIGIVLTLGLSGCGVSAGGAAPAPETPTTSPAPNVSNDYKAEFVQLPGGGRVLCIRNMDYASISCDWSDYAGQNRHG